MEYNDKFWMVYVEGTKGCSYKHNNRTEAMEEAERLIRLTGNNDKRVYLLETIGCVHFKPQPVEWEHSYPTSFTDHIEKCRQETLK